MVRMNDSLWSAPGIGDLRAADADRDRTAEALRQAVAEGRLDIDELQQRLERTYSAKTYAELALITADLPIGSALARRGEGSRVEPFALPTPGPSSITAVLRDERITGRWLVPRRVEVRTMLGQVMLDFTDVALPHEVVLDVHVAFGQLTLIVPDDIAVDLDQCTTVAARRVNRAGGVRAPGTPCIRVRGLLVASKLVARPPKRRWLRRR